jgi:hypothetical protein
MFRTKYVSIFLFIFIFALPAIAQVDPDTAMKASIDRFSMDAGTLFVRDSSNGLPGPNEPIDFDQGPFITHGLGPNGEFISYYNFDVMPTEPAPIYVLFREGEPSPVPDQLNIVGVIPGDMGYNDFWRVNFVTVPQNYVANTITKVSEIISGSYPIEETDILVNCPIVPDSSTAMLRYNISEDPGLTRGWYETMVVFYFNFSEKALMVDGSGMVPLSPIYVCFNINPGEPGGGPPSGFVADSTGRTHNVTTTLPEDMFYSPLWSVNIYDNADFDMVHDLTSAQMANILVMGAANVNCPVVENESSSDVEPVSGSLPNNYVLDQNYPNPFNPTTTIRFSIPESDLVLIKIYNSIGEQVAELVNRELPAGSYTVDWNAENNSSGIYFYTLSANNFASTKKMILLK